MVPYDTLRFPLSKACAAIYSHPIVSRFTNPNLAHAQEPVVASHYESLMDQDVNEDDIVDVYAVEGDDVDDATKTAGRDQEDDETSGSENGTSATRQNQEAIFAAIGCTSFIFLIQTGYDCDHKLGGDTDACKDKLAFGVATATISLFTVLVHFLVIKIPQVGSQCGLWKQCFEPFLMTGLWSLWGIAAITLTYPDHTYEGFSYIGIGNGWLMIWSSVALTTIALYPSLHPAWKRLQKTIPVFEKLGAPDGQNVVLLVGVMLCSVTVMWSASDICDALNDNERAYGTDCKDQYAWAVVCSLFSFVYSLGLLLFGKCVKVNERVFKALSLFLVLWWFLGMAVCTVSKPFASPAGEANGFFGIWLALAFSALIAARNWGIQLHIGA